MTRVVVIGATSAIAQACARRLAGEGARFVLVARNGERLASVAADLRSRGAGHVATFAVDLTETTQHGAILELVDSELGHIDVVLIAHGTLPVQTEVEDSFDKIRESFEDNALSVIALMTLFAQRLEAQRGGTLAVISSVAGDRGRGSNYVYGAAKAAVSAFLAGLRNRLHACGVHVLTIKPGLVDSPMTAGFEKSLLWSTPDRVADDIIKAISRKRDVVYTPFFWRYVMLVIRLIPERLFKRLKL